MKRTIIFTLLCIVALSCAFAGKTEISVKVSPYALQTVKTSGGTYVSDYGYGVAGEISTDVWNNVTAGLDLNIGIFKFDELDSDYNVISFRGVAGYRYDFTDKLFANADLGLGVDLRIVGSVENTSFSTGLYLGGGFRFSEEMAVTAGVDVALCFQASKKSKSTDFGMKTWLGLSMGL